MSQDVAVMQSCRSLPPLYVHPGVLVILWSEDYTRKAVDASAMSASRRWQVVHQQHRLDIVYPRSRQRCSACSSTRLHGSLSRGDSLSSLSDICIQSSHHLRSPLIKPSSSLLSCWSLSPFFPPRPPSGSTTRNGNVRLASGGQRLAGRGEP